MNCLKLKGIIVEKGLTQEGVAKMIGMNKSTFYRKIKSNGANFTVGDVRALITAVQLTAAEVRDIFFPDFVA